MARDLRSNAPGAPGAPLPGAQNAGEGPSRGDELVETLTGSGTDQHESAEANDRTFNGQQAGEAMDLDDENRIEELEEDNRPTNGWGPNQAAGQSGAPNPAAVQPGAPPQAPAKTVQQEVDEITASRRKAHLLAKLEQLRREEDAGFPLESRDHYGKEPDGPEDLSYEDKLALEKAKTVKDPDPPYSGESQEHLDVFIRQVDNVFLAKPLTYESEEEKCRYAGGYLRGIPAEDWDAYDEKNSALDEPQYSYQELKDTLQERLRLRCLRQVNVGYKLKVLRQRNNQSVGDLVAHLETLERKLDPQPTDPQRHQHLLFAIHAYLRDALVRHDKIGNTREELEEAACSMENVEPAPEGITVQRLYPASRGTTTGSKRPSNKPVPNSSNAGNNNDAPRKESRESQQPRGKKRRRDGLVLRQQDKSWVACYKCGKPGHIQSDCRSGNSSGNSGKEILPTHLIFHTLFFTEAASNNVRPALHLTSYSR